MPVAELATTSAALFERALQSRSGPPDQIQCRADLLDPREIEFCSLPDVHSWQVADAGQGRRLAADLLRRSGASAAAIRIAQQALASGAAGGGANMRGMMIVDADSGERLEEDRQRGIRVSRMDLALAARQQIEARLARAGLNHHRVAEALVLAGKVLQVPGVLAELCWSDAPDYLTGYVASPDLGYQRISPLKETGDPHGGRALFVDRRHWQPEQARAWLERRPVLFETIGTIHPTRSWPA